MSGTTDLAIREETALAPQFDAALAIQAGQTAWTPMQEAALNQIGLKDAPDGDRMVFLHQCERTGLDPFAKQIYMIPRNEKKSFRRNGQWEDEWTTKWTIQTGIEGWRTIRDRAEKREGIRGQLSRFTYYDLEGKPYPVWVKPQPPVACEFTYTVIDRHGNETPYTSVLRFAEYVQLKDGKPVAQWAAKPVHMIEKCTESDSYRKAFPQDYSGIELADAAPRADIDWENLSDEELDARYQEVMRQNRPRKRVTADTIRARSQTVTATVVTEDPSPAPEAPSPAPQTPPSAESAGDGPTRDDLLLAALTHLDRLGVEKANRLGVVALIARKRIANVEKLSDEDVRKVHDTLEQLEDGSALDGLRADLLEADDPTGDSDA